MQNVIKKCGCGKELEQIYYSIFAEDKLQCKDCFLIEWELFKKIKGIDNNGR